MDFEFIELEQIETLKTLEYLVSEVDVYINQSKNYVRGYGIVSEWNEFLKSYVKLSDFVPCGADGLPLKEPKESDFKDVPNYRMALHRYQKAKQAVIFDYPNIDLSEMNDGFIYWTDGNKDLSYNLDTKEFSINDEQGDFYVISTYSDLAKATIDNPLKFRK